jgi:hypothetical protein
MGRKAQIAILALVALLLLGVAVGYAYDSSEKDKIADGVTVGGVDVGGMDEAEARQAVSHQLLGPLKHSLRVGYDGRSWTLPGKGLKVHADINAAIEEAVAESRSGGFPGRLVRYVTGSGLDKQIGADVTYSKPAINRFVRRVAAHVDREAQDATVEPGPDSLEVVAAKNGRKLRDNLLTSQLEAAVLNADADHAIAARTHSTKPEVTTKEVASAYPSYLTLDRSTFTLRLWKHLKLAKTYTVAVGQEGSRRALPHPGKAGEPLLARSRLRLGGRPGWPGDPSRPGRSDQGALDGDLRRRRDPRHRRDRIARLRRLARLRADVDPRRDRAVPPG